MMTNSTAESQPKAVAPTTTSERIDVMDILRGFALLGILLVNMGIFSFPFLATLTGTPRGSTPLDAAAEFIIQWLAAGKFYPLFSFLFGAGMALQMARIEERGGRVGRFMARRLLILMGFGLLHALLIWNGDILFIYGLTGLALVLFRKLEPKLLLIWAGVLFAIPFVLALLSAGSTALLGGMATGGTQEFDTMGFLREFEQRAIQVYGSGTWGEIFVWRAIEWLIFLVFTLFGQWLQLLALFLVGMVFIKRGYLQNSAEHLPLFRRGLRLGLGIGLPANFIIALLDASGSSLTSVLPALGQAMALLAGPLLTLGYISAFVLLTQSETWRNRCAPLAAAGRMALSNYLAQSIVCTFIFYSFGLGLFGQVGAFAGLVLSVVIWLVQLPISMLWLSRFRFGPVEWLWRTLTYGEAQPMSKQARPEPALS
jgi:uncharacterized protein